MTVHGINNGQYARWVTVVGRTMRMNPLVEGSLEELAARSFIAFMYKERPWLRGRLHSNSERLQGLVRADNPQAYGKNVEVVGRDILRVPIRDEAEKAQVDTLLAATGDRMHGGGPEFVERLA